MAHLRGQDGLIADPHLSEADAFTLSLERDPLLRSTIVAVAVFDRAPDWDRFAETIDRATRLEPNFRHRLVGGTNALMPSRWVADPAFDLSWHLRRVGVPSPGTLDEVLEFARVAGTTAFDPERPRWEFTLMEVMADGGAALVMKVHHALTDGIGGIQIAQHVVDLDRGGTPRVPVPEPPPGPADATLERLQDAAVFRSGRTATVVLGTLSRTPGAVISLALHPLRTSTAFLGAIGSVFRFVRPITSTISPVMTDRELGWRYQPLSVPLRPMKRTGALISGTLNDAFLAGVAGGIARYHHRHGSDASSMRITMPVSTRSEDDAAGGNRITLVRFEIPSDADNPLERMLAIHRLTAQWRHEQAVEWTEGIAGALNLLPTAVAAGMLKHVDVVASNVPGFDIPVYVAGARLERFLAFGPTIGAAANLTLMSYRDRCDIGLTTDVGAVEDPEVLLDCLRESFDELVSLGVDDPEPAAGRAVETTAVGKRAPTKRTASKKTASKKTASQKATTGKTAGKKTESTTARATNAAPAQEGDDG